MLILKTKNLQTSSFWVAVERVVRSACKNLWFLKIVWFWCNRTILVTSSYTNISFQDLSLQTSSFWVTVQSSVKSIGVVMWIKSRGRRPRSSKVYLTKFASGMSGKDVSRFFCWFHVKKWAKVDCFRTFFKLDFSSSKYIVAHLETLTHLFFFYFLSNILSVNGLFGFTRLFTIYSDNVIF